ncbi:MAG: DUF1223 domain-containing protein [Verrucomicrobia bacterium]|nr:DUF1223 domain-containing protein [Verrucomicrobiota bacterium]
MRPFFVFSAAFALGAGLLPVRAAEPIQFASGPARVSLIELYTSEGCSSCPPAERWLGKLRDAPGLWRDFVPVAFHVDYWNRLGWPDRFSSKEFTQREYAYAAAWNSESVYTPCFVRDGTEWRAREVPRASGAGEAGMLTVSYDVAKGGLRADFVPAPTAGDGPRKTETTFEVHAAILGAGIVSKVTSGENRGETLGHEFIALALAHGVPGREIALAVPTVAGVPRHALAVWVTRKESLVPVQATGGWLP